MKDKVVIDLAKIMDDVFEAAQSFKDNFEQGDFNFQDWEEKFRDFGQKPGPGAGFHHGPRRPPKFWEENMDFYPSYSYPPMNVYMTKEREIIFEFAMAGFDEKSIDLQFVGDYMVFSASIPEEEEEPEGIKYFKRRLKMKDIKEQQYYVPEDKFNREQVKAKFKNGILKVSIPPKEEFQTKEGIKIEIVGEDE